MPAAGWPTTGAGTSVPARFRPAYRTTARKRIAEMAHSVPWRSVRRASTRPNPTEKRSTRTPHSRAIQ
ncbi:Uncharacterised protein [Bordetella pertussis]|nr:Uncharacterised protein [Bordetella pertussis]